MQPRLRLFSGDLNPVEAPSQPKAPSPRVAMRLDEFIAILGNASQNERTWLADFADEEISLSADLHEVMTAYSQLRPSA